MSELLRALGTDPLTQLVSLVFGATGVILAVFFFLRSRRIAELRYDYSNRPLIENLSAKLDGLEVRFHGVPQERITVTRVAFWNAGTEVLRSSDLTPLAPLAISFSDGLLVLDVRLVYESDVTSQLSLHQSADQTGEPDGIQLRFDYLDRGEGGVVQVVHTGDGRTRPRLLGKIKGGRPISLSEAIAYRRVRWFGPFAPLVRSRTMGWLVTAIYAVGALIMLLIPLQTHGYWYVLATPVLAFLAWAMYRTYVSDILPREFGDHLLGTGSASSAQQTNGTDAAPRRGSSA